MAIALRDVKLSDPLKCLKWIYLLPNLHRFSYSSTSGFRSRLSKGRNQTTFIPRVSHDMRSIFLNLSKPRSYNSFVKSRVGPKICMKMQDNLEGFLSSELPSHPNLTRGQLENGLRYCILPHKRLPNRFEAHLEVHVGSMHEEEDEQGIAHMTEHVIESDKFSELFYVGATYGAYTYFSGTVYHINSQVTFEHCGLLPHVLDALNEQAFKPKIRVSYLEKERNVVLSELQMWNTIDFRIEGKLCQLLHSENKLNKRYNVLGLEEQIKNWSVAQIKKFHKRWYFPGNATLYIVGDINDVSKTIDAIQEAFGKSKRFQNKRSVEIFKNKGHGHPIRPLTLHNWSLARSNTDDRKPLQIFQHNLIHNFSFYIFSKVPVNKFQTYGDLRNFVMKQIYLSALRFRINAKYKSSNSSATLIELSHLDKYCTGCARTLLGTTSEPKDWKTAIKVAFHEVQRLKELGISYDEFTLHKDVMLNDCANFIAVLDDDSSSDIITLIMRNDALGRAIMEEREAHKVLAAVATTITLDEVNSIGAELLELVSDFGKPSAPVPTIIMACAPTTHEVKGELVGFTVNPSEIEFAMKQGLDEIIMLNLRLRRQQS